MKWTLTIASFASLAAALGAGWYGFHGILTAGFLGFAFLLFAANLDRISEFRATATGVEAKTRDVLQRAEHTLSELQVLARTVAKTALSLVKRSGRLGGYNDDEEESFKRSILNVLDEIGVPETELSDVLYDWHRLTEFDYILYMLGHSRVPEGFEGHDIFVEWKALRSFDNMASPDRIREFLTKWDILTPEREEYVKDYEYYRDHKRHRRPDVWKDRKNLKHLQKKSM